MSEDDEDLMTELMFRTMAKRYIGMTLTPEEDRALDAWLQDLKASGEVAEWRPWSQTFVRSPKP